LVPWGRDEESGLAMGAFSSRGSGNGLMGKNGSGGC